jgi:hypothetical protein
VIRSSSESSSSLSTLHRQLGVLLPQPGQLRPLIFTQLGPVAAAAPVGVHPVPQVPSLMPRSLVACAIGLPVSRTSRRRQAEGPDLATAVWRRTGKWWDAGIQPSRAGHDRRGGSYERAEGSRSTRHLSRYPQ